MTSLNSKASRIQKQKLEAGRLRRKSEREFLQARSLAKRSTSGLVSIQRKIESSKEQLGDVSSVLTQRLAQQESLKRLTIAAEERLKHEKEAKEQTEQDLEFAESEEEKQRSLARIHAISDRINDLLEEIKQRNKMAKKVTLAIEDFQKSKSRISSKIQKQSHSKPSLQKLIKRSKNATKRLAKQVASKTRQEQSAKQSLSKINKKLAELAAKRRKKIASRVSKIKKIKPKIKSKKKKIKKKIKKLKSKRRASKNRRSKKTKTRKPKTKKKSKTRPKSIKKSKSKNKKRKRVLKARVRSPI